MYHILYKTPLLELPTGVTIQAATPIDAINIFNETFFHDVVFLGMYKLNEKGNFEW